ncbi:MAG: hypothetical protein K0Q74_463 [Gammaproteobacteria bacterium]|jgi:4-amino-4-deoxy-L-arabinose transferase-like glycosyltransferase|nr:hypothetical protein [Gammaproteobacteria bacterium]
MSDMPLLANMLTRPSKAFWSAEKIFYTFLVLHVLVWAISPLLIRHTVSGDAIESFVWGQYLDWGYDRNPYLVGWITRLSLWLDINNHAIGYYFMQQLMIGLGFWSLWKLGNLLFSPYRALVAVLMYTGCLYFSVYVQTNNDNFPLVGLWGVAAYVFYLACKKQAIKYWLITGLMLGLAMMVKYSTIIFMSGLFLYLLIEKEARQSFRQPGVYLGAVIFLLPVLPNLVWLFQHDFVAFHYVSDRGGISGDSYVVQKLSLSYLFSFMYQTALNFLGCLVLFALTAPRLTSKSEREKATTYYLWCIGLFPMMLVLSVALVLSWQLYWEWGVPFIIFWGLVLVHYFTPKTHPAAILRFVVGVLLAMFASLLGNILISCYLNVGSGTGDYPARQIAQYVNEVWQTHYDQPLRFVAGSRYTGGYAAFYAADKPKVFVDWNATSSPGVSEESVRKSGAIFVEDSVYGAKDIRQFSPELMQKYPHLILLPVKRFSYHRNEKSGETVDVLVGILPPANP